MLCLECGHRNKLTDLRCTNCRATLFGNHYRSDALRLLREGKEHGDLDRLLKARELEPRLVSATEAILQTSYEHVLDTWVHVEAPAGEMHAGPPPPPPKRDAEEQHVLWMEKRPELITQLDQRRRRRERTTRKGKSFSSTFLWIIFAVIVIGICQSVNAGDSRILILLIPVAVAILIRNALR